MAVARGFTRATGPSGWVERAGKRHPISGWEIVSLQTSRPDSRGWFRCTSHDFDARSGEGLHVHLRNWELRDQEIEITLARPREGGAVWEFQARSVIREDAADQVRAK